MHPKEKLWRQGLRLGWHMRFRPRGDSMIPFLRQGDVVTIVPGNKCRVGDIILVDRESTLMLHRVIAKRNGEIITKGDALRSLDKPVSFKDILGKAVFRERGGRMRSLDSLAARLLGMAFSLTLPLLPKMFAILVALERLGRDKLGLSFS